MTNELDSQEIVLEDRFTTEQGANKISVNPVSINTNIQASLPAALCDEALLEEIKNIPDKMGFKIGDVAEMLGVKQYVLRYWESEFDVLKPKKATNNQRFYTRKDVENAYIIRKLLHRDRFSIERARSALKDVKSYVKKEKNWDTVQTRIETMQDKIDDLVIEIQKAKKYFL